MSRVCACASSMRRRLHEERRRRGLHLVLHVDLEGGELERAVRPGEHVVDRLVRSSGCGLPSMRAARRARRGGRCGRSRHAARGLRQDQHAALALHLEHDEQRREAELIERALDARRLALRRRDPRERGRRAAERSPRCRPSGASAPWRRAGRAPRSETAWGDSRRRRGESRGCDPRRTPSAVRKMTGTSASSGRERSCFTSAQPSRRGIITSVMMRSGGAACACASPSSPSRATSTS